MKGKYYKSRFLKVKSWVTQNLDVLDALKLIGISGRDRVPYIEVYSNLDLSKVRYRTYKHAKEEKLSVMERKRPDIFIHSENA
jgi:hypothetical protein